MTVRRLAIIGSGETTPTLARVHRALLEGLGPSPVPAVVVDTPYGFQENADDISGRALDYFRETVGNACTLASLRSADVDALTRSSAVARIREARYVFAGPGSPSYALRQWAGTEIPSLLAEKLVDGGVLAFASAAALTLGSHVVPVYEIYKVGEPPHWLPGLDLLSKAVGLRAAVVPHYDNAEGGNHDTRFCYLGERRLAVMEQQLPDDVFVLGVDGHTALILDLEHGTATVQGLGSVTVRWRGVSTVFPADSSMPIEGLREAAMGARTSAIAGAGAEGGSEALGGGVSADGPADGAETPELAGVSRDLAGRFDRAIEQRDVDRAVGAILELDAAIVEWSRDTGPTHDFDRARAILRALVVRLGEVAEGGVRDPREVLSPFVDELVGLRSRARAMRDYETSDAIRRSLADAGVEVHDEPQGTTWELTATSAELG